MLRSVQAVVENDGSLRLLEDVEIRVGDRAIVTFLDEEMPSEPALLSQEALTVDWARPEEDEAWAYLEK